MLEGPRIELQSGDAFVRGFEHVVDGLGFMTAAKDSGRGRSILFPQLHRGHDVSAGAFRRGTDIEAEQVEFLMRTTDMKSNITIRRVTLDGGKDRLLADFARRFKSVGGNEAHAFCGFERLGPAKLDLWGPDGAGHMHPVVPGRSLKGLARIGRSPRRFLLLSV